MLSLPHVNLRGLTLFAILKSRLRHSGLFLRKKYGLLYSEILSSDAVFAHSITSNIGDLVCCPLHYFPHIFCNGKEVSNQMLARFIQEAGAARLLDLLNGRPVIFGGGGLIGMERHNNHTDVLQVLSEYALRGGKVVLWGVGHNRISDFETWYRDHKNHPYPAFIRNFLVGVRDQNVSHNWVPCVSCMCSVFDKKYEAENEVAAFLHGDESDGFLKHLDGVPVYYNLGKNNRSDRWASFEAAIAFIASAKLIVTNSYHGAYWAKLLQRDVIAIPNSSKFLSFKYNITLCPDIAAWKHYRSSSSSNCDALSECRTANSDFSLRVVEFLRS